MSAPVLAYAYRAALYCEDCIGWQFDRLPGETTEDVLDRVAEACGINRDLDNDPLHGINQNDFPCRTYDVEDCIDEENRPSPCDDCLAPLGVQPF